MEGKEATVQHYYFYSIHSVPSYRTYFEKREGLSEIFSDVVGRTGKNVTKTKK